MLAVKINRSSFILISISYWQISTSKKKITLILFILHLFNICLFSFVWEMSSSIGVFIICILVIKYIYLFNLFGKYEFIYYYIIIIIIIIIIIVIKALIHFMFYFTFILIYLGNTLVVFIIFILVIKYILV